MSLKFLVVILSMSVSGSALAADLPETEPNPELPIPQAQYDPWTGFYAGFSAAYTEAEDDDPAFPIMPGVTIPLHSSGDEDGLGVFIGGTIQDGNFVYGAEYEYQDLDLQFVGDGLGPLPIVIEDAHILKARLGYALSDTVQVYGTGGAMRTRINIGMDDWSPLVGFGVDYKLTENLILGGQYSHSWFDDYDYSQIDGDLDTYAFRVMLQF